MNVEEGTILYGQLHNCYTFCIVSDAICGGIFEPFTMLLYQSFKVDESIKQLRSLSSVKDSSLLHGIEMLLLVFLLVLINGVVPEQLSRRWNICVYMCLKN